ncbi:DUF421 domain-containing protein [Calidifontibacillus oryziterrae]|uniref:DUF421 domain-containing protein n=1 Tax=Calidifontibacillus oryziterrae TaxID=1191699 RepID=UPI0002DE734D|nr:DUF421 domain-containing protein [Calidifontibacillus oryziterrae]
MEWDFIWKSIVLVTIGTVLLRVAGRKSISQMTVAQTVIMISIGSLIIQPIVETSVVKTVVASSIFIASLILMEYLQLKFNFFEKFLTGKAKVVIKDGIIMTDTLRSLRFSVDQLEMRLRQQGIQRITDVKTATLEPNGQIGYELKRYARPVTIGELEKMLNEFIGKNPINSIEESTLFDEVKIKGHEIPNYSKLH